ncbi:MAG: RelA/SpoT domain-containing protein [Bacteroidetes bacterium]|nr:RelA/SpoT domain-containing protein [Bacteroidota bacterium]MBU1483530.1 RelA/SpoT domain-containing protein [Bacteroidota bacterium]MBU1759772.1 RelA/SpoT domain-containing protein [Bacteroidota bacterium]MBU2046972.1 RelA/SpoT domain-containing protein [Bacteroidota bacterium]MBU2269239.1 RelA/SpoT domain-containing protein [Bacteroidota bacterium]
MFFSRNRITRAGEILMTSSSELEVNDALEIINTWRSHHLHPLRVMKNSLIKLSSSNKVTPILVSQRLKRLTSIEYKLDLNEKMGLGGMQDIGGFRAVLKDVRDLEKLKKLIQDSRLSHKLERISDYVDEPKDSGYRSIHFVYKYNSKVEKYDGLRLELQIRTKLQHNWATAVETAGIITNTSLKSSKGPDEWLSFFKIVSSLFAIKEQLPVLKLHTDKSMEDLMIECYNSCKELKIIETLRVLGVTTNHLEQQNFPGDYYLININIETKSVQITVFDKNSLEKASEKYLEIEKNIKEQSKNAVVLVAANSMRLLKKAYPSYFLDTTEFLTALERINDNCITRGYLKNNR